MFTITLSAVMREREVRPFNEEGKAVYSCHGNFLESTFFLELLKLSSPQQPH
jgi:hypothetical protein